VVEGGTAQVFPDLLSRSCTAFVRDVHGPSLSDERVLSELENTWKPSFLELMSMEAIVVEMWWSFAS
jgi:hypothetical protein